MGLRGHSVNPHYPGLIRVLTARQATDADAAAINDSVPSRALMQRAGAAAATEIARRYGDRLSRGVTVFVGSGKNGGDGWVVAGALASAGFPVKVEEVVQFKAEDAKAEREQTLPVLPDEASGAEIIVDALLGTGAQGEPRGAIAEAISRINSLKNAGSAVVALDLPSGLNADTGETAGCLHADLTITFGTLKRGHLLARSVCGEIAVVDSGMRKHAWSQDPAPMLIDGQWAHSHLPVVPANAHKGTKKTLAIVGGGPNMPGAVILAAQAALRSGIGLLRLYVHDSNLDTVRRAVPAAITSSWDYPEGDSLLIGPGLGQSADAQAIVGKCLAGWRHPIVVDADALNLLKDIEALIDHDAVITPHPLELARLVGSTTQDVNARRFDLAAELASRYGIVVLLKGIPTIIASPSGERFVSATGTPALATGGSGDVLGGVLATIFAQSRDSFTSAACAAWIHGRAAELCGGGGNPRGAMLEEIIDTLPLALNMTPRPTVYPVLCELP